MNNWIKLAVFLFGACLLFSPVGADAPDRERQVNLQGTQNTRDIGGYEAADGRRVRWDSILRSENLSRLRRQDFTRLEAMGLKTIVDLRTVDERSRSPTVWQGDNPPEIFTYAIGDDDDIWVHQLNRLMRAGRFTKNQTMSQMVEGYRGMAEAGEESFRKLMALVIDDSNWPLLIHCSAGKDRTGVAVTLILEALGVDDETIMQEFLLTNKIIGAEAKAIRIAGQKADKSISTGSRINGSRTPSAAAYFPLIGVSPEMLEAFYDGVDENYGSMDAYLAELGLDENSRRKLADSLTK